MTKLLRSERQNRDYWIWAFEELDVNLMPPNEYE